jgi:hypothetical protein
MPTFMSAYPPAFDEPTPLGETDSTSLRLGMHRTGARQSPLWGGERQGRRHAAGRCVLHNHRVRRPDRPR